jgi:predicted AlkP superfamily pyrophosphatase or phosphodiesterase
MKLFFFLFFWCHFIGATAPKVAIIVVVDQLGQQTLQNLKPYFTGGFKMLFDNAIIFNQAIWPSGMPATATNHAGLATGTTAKNHGIVDNSWFDHKNNEVKAVEDFSPETAVFAKQGFFDYGVSSYNLMVDTLADQIMLQSSELKKNKVFCLSHKDRAAALCAGKLGKALWFDEKSMQFTSSKAYFKVLPDWLQQFNAQHPIDQKTYWHLFFDKNNKAYALAKNNVYNHSRKPALYQTEVEQQEYLKTPHAQNLLFELAKNCFAYEYDPSDNLFVLFISVSTPDKTGHYFTAQSLEYSDLLYYLDSQLQDFMQTIHTKVDPQEVLWLLTADHASMPLVEDLQKQGYSAARRIDKHKLQEKLNEALEKKFGLKNLISYVDTPDFYVNHAVFDCLEQKKQGAIIKTIKHELRMVPGIKKVWTGAELQKRYYGENQFESYFQNQYFPGRSGDLIIQVFPYTMVGKNMKGTSHKTPYHYDTHVPLMLYQQGSLEKKQINHKVWMQQITPTLAQILGVPAPSAATFKLLTDII